MKTLAKDLVAVGEVPPTGVTPRKMHAWVINPTQHGEPGTAFRNQIIDTPQPGHGEVLVMVMAAGVNYNGVWAALGHPVSPCRIHGDDFHVAGSDASGVIWEIGPGVRNWHPGDEVVIHCNQNDSDDLECNGGNPLLSKSQRIWGYETNYGAFAQFTVVQSRQLLRRPPHLTWQESACYMLTLATSHRMLFGHPPHILSPGDAVLIWGAAGGLGSMAVQLAKIAGAIPIGVISNADRAAFVQNLGVAGVINRADFDCWGACPPPESKDDYIAYLNEVRRFGRAVRSFTRDARDVDIVFEHPGQTTFNVSSFVAKRGGMVVFCAATSGYLLTFDARFAWMRQKRIQGSHIATIKEASRANELVAKGLINPCLSSAFSWNDLPYAHELMRRNEHPPGNMAINVQAALAS